MKLHQRYSSVLASLLMSAQVSGCTTSSYMGIALAPGAADPVIQHIAQRANSGDKQAQLELGIAFEEGRGVRKDLQKALTLYRLAGAESRQLWVYSPSPGNRAPSRVERVDVVSQAPGLPEAKARLAKILRQREKQ